MHYTLFGLVYDLALLGRDNEDIRGEMLEAIRKVVGVAPTIETVYVDRPIPDEIYRPTTREMEMLMAGDRIKAIGFYKDRMTSVLGRNAGLRAAKEVMDKARELSTWVFDAKSVFTPYDY